MARYRPQNGEMCFLCFMYFMCFLQQNQKKYEQDLMFFSSRDMTEQCYSFQIITDPCVLYVFWSLYFRYYAMHVFYEFYVFFSSSRDMTEQCCSFQTITNPCVLCVLCVFWKDYTSDIMACMCFTCFMCFFFQET